MTFEEEDMPDIAAGLPIDDGHIMRRYLNIDPDDLVAAIIARPGGYDACLLGLAHAYESQRERIADLEDDVERLRTREPFVPEVLFECEADGVELQMETQCRGGLTITHRGDDGDYRSVLTHVEATALTTALSKWAGLDGVEWTPISEPPKSGVDVLFRGGGNIANGYMKDNGVPRWTYFHEAKVTHWAPLPKPPVVKS